MGMIPSRQPCTLVRLVAVLLALGSIAHPQGRGGAAVPALSHLDVLAWNIWHGGKEDGEAGLERTIEVIRSSGADLVAMQETYGSGERIAEALGFTFHPRGTNVSIHSRFPVIEDISVHKEFQCAGALVELPGGERLAFFSVWLPYAAEIWAEGTRAGKKQAALLAACEPSRAELAAILRGIEERLAGEAYAGVPVILAGDFNSMSHLDYGEVGFDQYAALVAWPTSRLAMGAGFLDAYRACHGIPDRARDATWTPRFPEQEQDRIDYVYLKGAGWEPERAQVLRTHPGGFPSDHGALLVRLARTDAAPPRSALRVASYNIRHGSGMDGRVDLPRTAGVLRGLQADFIGLQEVDAGAERSGGQAQVVELARTLGMQPAFGKFMDYDGGRYGMGILSAHPIVDVAAVPLPAGGEPRVALDVLVQLPGGQRMRIINVHFDWLEDDGVRMAQANALCAHLEGLVEPYLLVGDFNDVPDSRTMARVRRSAQVIPKPASGRFTFPAEHPSREIDYLLHGRNGKWQASLASVVSEEVASDHRPVFADVVLVH